MKGFFTLEYRRDDIYANARNGKQAPVPEHTGIKDGWAYKEAACDMNIIDYWKIS